MHKYFIKTPWFARKIFSSYIWSLPAGNNEVYLTFDDGPHPTITPWVLEELEKYDAKATFFCIGNNVERYPDVYKRILEEGHATGNHTFRHLNGWKTDTLTYLDDVAAAGRMINSHLFRPPYGRIRSGQANGVAQAMKCSNAKIIMWDVLSADFDRKFSAEKCLYNVTRHTEDGSIIVFHDSVKAFDQLEFCLPRALEWIKSRGWGFGRIDEVVTKN